MLCSLQRTNPRLTGNIKIVITDNDMYMESIDSSRELQRIKYKDVKYNTDFTFAQNIRKFTNLFTDISELYTITNEDDIKVSSNLSGQYQQRYDYGCYSSVSNIVNGKFRFFAPLYITSDDVQNLPDAFVIYKLNKYEPSFENAIKNGTLIKSFDIKQNLTYLTSSLQDSCIRARFDTGFEAVGINVKTGVYDKNSDAAILSILANERTLTEFENFVTNSFMRSNFIFSNVINLEFAFDTEELTEFERYVGFYVKHNNTTIEHLTDDVTFKLINTKNGIIQYKSDYVLQQYDKQVTSVASTSMGIDIAPQLAIDVYYNPSQGDKFILSYLGIQEISITLDSTIINSNKEITIDNLIDRINNTSTKNITITASKTSSSSFKIQSNSANINFENITATLPTTFVVNSILYNNTTYNKTFYGGHRQTFVTTKFIPFSLASKVKIQNEFYNIIRIVKYDDYYLYKVDRALPYADTSVRYVQFYQTQNDQLIACSVIDHYTFDYDKTITEYSDVVHFDSEKFRTYLLDIVNSDDYTGSLDINATPQEISDYKENVISQINKYFDNIQIERQYLLKNIDIISLEATTIDNEYNRLNENALTVFQNKNRLYQFINKWGLRDATDVYYNTYRLNTHLQFRYDNFSPSIVSIDRDIRYHTHDWLILAEGANPYLELSEETVSKHLSYSKQPIELDDVGSISNNVFDNFEYETDLRKHIAYSKIIYDDSYNACRTFFRGLLLEFADVSLHEYKFAAVLKTRYATDDDATTYEFIRNDVFKTLTLFVSFYIPDPILTKLERSDYYYYLDRSLLYFSNEIYSTKEDSVDFGYVPISVDLYNTNEPKVLLGQQINTINWFVENSSGRFVYVKTGDRAIFKSFFTDLLTLEEDFSIRYTSTDDMSDPNYGMTITFKNIREIKAEYFWCEDIIISYVLTEDGADPKDTDDNTVISQHEINIVDEYKLNANLFYENNIAYISKAIAYENSEYRRAIKSKVNIARYRNISTASIVKTLNTSSIHTKQIDIYQGSQRIQQTYQTCRVIEPQSSQIVVSLTENSNEIKNNSAKYVFNILRYYGAYVPLIKPICIFSNSTYDKTKFNKVLSENRYRRLTSLLQSNTNIKNNEAYSDTYDICLTSNMFSYESNIYQWVSNPSEYRSLSSIVLNTANVLTANVLIQNGQIDIVTAFYNIAESIIDIDAMSLTDQQKTDILSLYTDVNLNTLTNFDFVQTINKQFILQTLMKLYDIHTITVNSQRIEFTFDMQYVYVNAAYNNSNAVITIKRKSIE